MPRPFQNCLEKIFPLSCLFVCLIFFTPLVAFNLPLLPTLKIHMASYLILGIFFEIPELILNARCCRVARNPETLRKKFLSIKRIFRIRYILTHYIGPCSGIFAVMSGLYLVDLGSYSLTEGWLFWVLIAAIIGLYKGMNQHNYYVKYIYDFLQSAQSDEQFFKNLQYIIQSPFDRLLILSEFPTYVFIYVTAYYKPTWFINPLNQVTRDLEHIVNPALCGLILVALGGLLIPILRKSMNHWSHICLSRFSHQTE